MQGGSCWKAHDITDLPVHTRGTARALRALSQINQLYADPDAARNRRPRGLGAARPRRRTGGGRMGNAQRTSNQEIAENAWPLSPARRHERTHRDAALTASSALLEIAGGDCGPKPRVLLLDEARRRGSPEEASATTSWLRSPLCRADVHGIVNRARHGFWCSRLPTAFRCWSTAPWLVEGPPRRSGARDPQVKAVYLGEGRRCLIFLPSNSLRRPATARPWCCPRCR